MRRRGWRNAAVLAGLCALALGTELVAGGARAATSRPSALPRFGHVFVIVLENEAYEDTFGEHSAAPYLARALTRRGVLLREYYGTGHASLDNYVAMLSGQAATPETRDDCETYADFVQSGTTPDGQAIGHGCVYPVSVRTLVDQLAARHLRWRGYMEDMGNDPRREPPVCGHPPLGASDPTQTAEGPTAGVPHGDQYAARHNPFVYFHSIIDTPECAANVVPLDRLAPDLAPGRTPNLVFITPNLCHDGHDAPCRSLGSDGRPEPGGLRSADAFLRQWVPKILASEAYRRDGLLIIAFDEGDSKEQPDGPGKFRVEYPGRTCCDEQPGPNLGPFPQTQHWQNYTLVFDDFGGDRTGAVLLSSRLAAGTVATTPFNHYSLLRTLEQAFGIEDYLGYAGQPGLIGFFEAGSDVKMRK